jgi:hypothetical protein
MTPELREGFGQTAPASRRLSAVGYFFCFIGTVHR